MVLRSFTSFDVLLRRFKRGVDDLIIGQDEGYDFGCGWEGGGGWLGLEWDGAI